MFDHCYIYKMSVTDRVYESASISTAANTQDEHFTVTGGNREHIQDHYRGKAGPGRDHYLEPAREIKRYEPGNEE